MPIPGYPDTFELVKDMSYNRVLDDEFSLRRYISDGFGYNHFLGRLAELGFHAYPPVADTDEGQARGFLEIANSDDLWRFAELNDLDLDDIEDTRLESAHEFLLEEVPELFQPLDIMVGGENAWFEGRLVRPKKMQGGREERCGSVILGAVTNGYTKLRSDRISSLYSLADMAQPADLEELALENAEGCRPTVQAASLEGNMKVCSELIARGLKELGASQLNIRLGPAVFAEKLIRRAVTVQQRYENADR